MALITFVVFSLIWMVVIAFSARPKWSHIFSIFVAGVASFFLANAVVTRCAGVSYFPTFQLNLDEEVNGRIATDDLELGKEIEVRKQAFALQYPQQTDKKLHDLAVESLDMGFWQKFLIFTERSFIWKAVVQDILDNPLFGKHSIRAPVAVNSLLYKTSQACSSYLGIISVHGLIGAFLLAGFYFRRIFEDKRRFILLLPLLLDGVTNDTLFWYLSLPDLLAMYLLTHANQILPVKKESF